MVRVHLKDAIVLNGREVVPAGTPATIRIINASKADIMDTYGFVDIFFEPLQLPDGRTLPLRAPTSRLAVNVSSGHESTVGVEDQIGDIFIPDYALYQIFRHGKNFVLSAGGRDSSAHRGKTRSASERHPCDRNAAAGSEPLRVAAFEFPGRTGRDSIRPGWGISPPDASDADTIPNAVAIGRRRHAAALADSVVLILAMKLRENV